MPGAAPVLPNASISGTAVLPGLASAGHPVAARDFSDGIGTNTDPTVESGELGQEPLRHEGKNGPGSTGTHCTSSSASASSGAPQPERETYYEVTIAADEEFMRMYHRVRAIQSIKAKPGEDIASTFKELMRD